ncbi:hypothetical protein TWF102_006698 [Orbilia oligospora]|uniref:B30.2/SPRY domain-containing protein n=1 Tax=Orbilia oligospora TaxID=2813651 RepID=A0A7C8J8I7_ORBOL|nr:hypothetical protein TWF102_006698 [Orbilia oligospora]
MAIVRKDSEATQNQAVGELENDEKIDSNPSFDPHRYSKGPLKEELTLEKSECWREGRKRFTNRLTDGKEPDKALAVEMNRFFDKTRTLQKTIDRCEEIQANAEKRSDSVGNLVDVLSSFKTIGDNVLSNAPDTIGAVWFAIGFVIKYLHSASRQIVADHGETCRIVADVYNQVSKIAIASLLYEERCSRLEPRDNGDGNLAALEKIIVDNIAALICEILEFFWNTQRWAVKLQSTSTEPGKDDELLEPKLTRAPTMRVESGTKAKTKGFGHAIGQSVKTAGKKAGGVLKDSVRTGIDAVKSGRDKIIEALTGELKEKAQNILLLYDALHADGSVHFEQTVWDSMQNMNEDVRNHLKDFKTGLDNSLQSLQVELRFNSPTDSMKRFEEKQDIGLENDVNILKGVQDVQEGIKILQEAKKSQIFERYITCFRRSEAHENLIQTLRTKKDQDGAANDRSWLLKQEVYKNWKSCSPKSSKIICLKAERGHGKTMTLLSVTSDLETYSDLKPDSTFVLRFFFKLGDSELQSILRAFESLLRQLLRKFSDGEASQTHDEKLERICKVLEENGIEKICQETQNITIKNDAAVSEENKNPMLIGKMISQISTELNLRLYIVLDALDECHDLKVSNIARCLKDLAYSEASNIWVIVSTRTSSQSKTDIEEELQQNGVALDRSIVQQNSPSADIVTLSNKENTEELQRFLELKLRDLVSRRVRNSTDVPNIAELGVGNFTSSGTANEVMNNMIGSLAKDINKIVHGDFSYANMLIANLQEPSKRTLKARIKELEGRGLEDMYKRNLDVLSPGKRSLILFALKWVVWSVSDITAIEIAEHYKEVYHETEEPDGNFIQPDYDPSDDPEIREIISHLRTAGHDFFSFSGDNDPVTAHASVGEWIRKGSSRPVNLVGSEACIVKSVGGRLVFEIAVPSESIPKDHNELSELMSEEASHLSIASDILRALTSKSFHARHMPWNPPKESAERYWNKMFPELQEIKDSIKDDNQPKGNQGGHEGESSKRRRYEIRHWHDHIKALQQHQRGDIFEEVKNSKWDSLRSLLEKFMKPDSWCRWCVQRNLFDGLGKMSYLPNFYQGPIHVASQLDLRFLIVHIYTSKKAEDHRNNPYKKVGPGQSTAESVSEDDGILDQCDGFGLTPLVLAIRDPKTVECLLNAGAKADKIYHVITVYTNPDGTDMDPAGINTAPAGPGSTPLETALRLARRAEAKDHMESLETMELLLKYGAKDRISAVLKDIIPWAMEEGEDSTKEIVTELQKKYSEITATVLKIHDHENEPLDVKTLYLSAMTAIAKFPTQAQAIWDRAEYLLKLGENVAGIQDANTLTPLHILIRAVYDYPDHAETFIPLIEQLVKRGADPLVSFTGSKWDIHFGNPVLLAVQTRNSKLIDIFLQQGEGAFLKKSLSGACVMHYFFRGEHKAMSEEDREIFQLLANLSPRPEALTTDEAYIDSSPRPVESDTNRNDTTKVPYFINAEDNDSREPLSWAVRYCDKDGVNLLLQNGADVNDGDEQGRTALYYLAQSPANFTDSIAILQDLHKFGADMRISTIRQVTVFAEAVYRQPPPVIREFIRILPRIDHRQKVESGYEHCAQESGGIDKDYLLQADDEGRNFLHCAADRKDRDKVDISDILEELIQSLAEDVRRKLLSQETSSRYTPLTLAAHQLNFPLINMLLKYSSAEEQILIEPQGSGGKSPLQAIAENLGKLDYKISRAKSDEETEGKEESLEPSSTNPQNKNEAEKSSGKCLNRIDYESTMIALLSMSNSNTEDNSILIRLRGFAIQMSWFQFLQELEARTGITLETLDGHGWNAFHIARYHGIDSSLIGGAPGAEPGDSPPGPMKLQTNSLGVADISQDGLEITSLSEETLVVEADHPINLFSGRYYFEVQVKIITQSTGDRDSLFGFRYPWSIGIIPLYEVFGLRNSKGTIGRHFRLEWLGDVGLVYYKEDPSNSASALARLSRWGQGRIKNMDTVGFGIDRETDSVFFTKNGEPVGILNAHLEGRCIPAFSVPRKCSARINFGGESFRYVGWEGNIEDIEASVKNSGYMTEY